MNKITLIGIATYALVGHPSYAQNLLQNGSFESPTVVSNTYQSITPTSWAWGSLAGAVFNGTIGLPWPPPYNGQQFVDIGNASVGSFTLSQTFTVTNQGVYVLRWFDSTGGGSSPYSVAVLTGAAQTVATTNLNAFHADTWSGHAMSMTLSSGIYTLRFSSGGGVYDTLLDDVSLEPPPDDDLLATIHFSAVDICWFGRTNHMYQVQYRTNLSATNWFDFGSPLLGTGTNCVTDGINGIGQRFYRIIRLP